jgi:hypothetical protein
MAGWSVITNQYHLYQIDEHLQATVANAMQLHFTEAAVYNEGYFYPPFYLPHAPHGCDAMPSP